MFKNLSEVDKFIKDIDGPVAYKNDYDYLGSDWRLYDDLDVDYPVQRILSKRECVFDFDDIGRDTMSEILDWLDSQGFKHITYQTSERGYHTHFWTNLEGKKAKKYLVKYLAGIIREQFGVRIDTLPMGHGFIRAEFSIHPTKKSIKFPIRANLNTLFYLNEVPHSLVQKVLPEAMSDGLNTGLNCKVNGKTPSCVKYMLSHKFADGRERMIFALVSWFKANKLSESQTVAEIQRWSKLQNYYVSSQNVRAKYRSSLAEVGCTYRHELLEELGVDMSHCKLEK